MKILKFLLFVVLLLLVGGIFIFIKNTDENEYVSNSIFDSNQVKGFEDSLQTAQKELPQKLSDLAPYAAQIQDFEARVHVKGDSLLVEISKTNQPIYQKTWPKLDVKNLICSDLNGNDKPEFWIFGFNSSNHFVIYGLEFTGKSFKNITFPVLMGRQKFGYQGKDSLFFSKSSIVRSFKFKNDLYSEIGTGTRECYYALGPDNSFVLNKMLDQQ